MPNKNDDSLLTFLTIVRNNQELYMKNQWQITYFSFLLYGAIIYSHGIVGKGLGIYFILLAIIALFSIIVIYKLYKSIKKAQDMANKVYEVFPSIDKI